MPDEWPDLTCSPDVTLSGITNPHALMQHYLPGRQLNVLDWGGSNPLILRLVAGLVLAPRPPTPAAAADISAELHQLAAQQGMQAALCQYWLKHVQTKLPDHKSYLAAVQLSVFPAAFSEADVDLAFGQSAVPVVGMLSTLNVLTTSGMCISHARTFIRTSIMSSTEPVAQHLRSLKMAGLNILYLYLLWQHSASLKKHESVFTLS